MSTQALRIEVPRALRPLLQPARFKGAYGGRGGAKSHFFAGQIIARACGPEPIRVACIREVQNTIKDSVQQLLMDKIAAFGLEGNFSLVDNEIRGINGSRIIFRGMQHYNADNIKSLEGFDIAWVEEAQSLSRRSFDLLRPTIRKPGSELWFSWNPENETDPVDEFFRKERRENAICVEVNWRDNPWLSAEMKLEVEQDYANNPERADHIWGGEYNVLREGAYFADLMTQARRDGRIGPVPHDPAVQVNTFWDLGMNDQTTIWFHQEVGREHRFIDYYANNGEGFAHYAKVLKELPYAYGRHFLPHDAEAREQTSGKHRRVVIEELGVRPTVIVPRIKQIGDGIEMVRQKLPLCWFDSERCAEGIRALQQYCREFDEKLNTFKPRPLHDWASHGADSFRQFAQGYSPDEVLKLPEFRQRRVV